MIKNHSLKYQSKIKKKHIRQIIELIRNSDYATGNLLDNVAIDLSKQTELQDPDLKQQINFIGRLEQNATIFFIIGKEEETILNFS